MTSKNQKHPRKYYSSIPGSAGLSDYDAAAYNIENPVCSDIIPLARHRATRAILLTQIISSNSGRATECAIANNAGYPSYHTVILPRTLEPCSFAYELELKQRPVVPAALCLPAVPLSSAQASHKRHLLTLLLSSLNIIALPLGFRASAAPKS